MKNNKSAGLIKIGVFYDGSYFLHVSNYYNYNHAKKARLSISGLHQFIRHEVAAEENKDVRLCQIVDSHYFRGRLNAQEASTRGNQLYYDRVFDDILMSEGVVTHYLPLRGYGEKKEKGIDVWLALEAYELAMYKQFDVLVLIGSDGDYVPLVRKLNSIGTRVMILSWDFEYTNDDGQKMITRTSQDLLEEVSYPIAMHELIDNRVKKNDPMISNLFVQSSAARAFDEPIAISVPTPILTSQQPVDPDPHIGEIFSLKNGYGFIKYPPNNLFFHYTNLVDTDFNELREGDEVEYYMYTNEKGEFVAKNVRLLYEGE